MFLEYRIMTFTARIRLKSGCYDHENGKIMINKIRLDYFFSRERKGLLKYLQTDGKIDLKIMGGSDGQQVLGSASLSLKDFKSEIVTRIAFNLPMVGQNCFIKAIACIDMT